MYSGKIVFSQTMSHLPLKIFNRCVKRYKGDYKVKSFSCLDQYLSMSFSQLVFIDSLRSTEICLRSQSSKLYHMGFRSVVSRNTLSNANKERDYRIYRDLAYELIKEAQELYAGGKLHDLNVLDMLTIEAGAFYIMDKAYIDFTRLYRINQASALLLELKRIRKQSEYIQMKKIKQVV